jgi:anthranilate synthase/aminodeoxychorismate synthase-like glutamine amidotransferase
MILVIDNYDSFTYNLVQLLGTLGVPVDVRRNDQVTLEEIVAMAPEGILLSPGPGRPESAGVTVEVIRSLGDRIPILGVCLGHQAIGHAFGARVIHAPTLLHGETSAIHHQGVGVFNGIPSPFTATRYHSLVVDPSELPEVLMVTARTADGIIMGLKHRTLPIEGVQFHPESILTEHGGRLLANWLGVHERT